MFCASRDRESWQGVASLRDATRKGVEQLARKSFSIRFSRALPILLILCDSCECPSRSDGPPVGWPCSERIAWQGVASLRRRRRKHIYANICAMRRCGHFAASLHKSPVVPRHAALAITSKTRFWYNIGGRIHDARRNQLDRVGPDDPDSPVRVRAELDILNSYERIRSCHITCPKPWPAANEPFATLLHFHY